MRDIKFRIWDKDKKKFLTNTDYKEFMIDTQGQVYSINGFFDNAKVDEYSGIVIQQFTGIKDYKGTEIYEGDIVEFTYNGLFLKGEVVFGNGGWELKGVDYGEHFRLIEIVHLCEVIGNIYENKEVLK